MKPTVDQINYLNIGLMIVSCFAAYALPFELFLFSYAVLGPLHYLTEISWLHDRKYFVTRERAARLGRGDRYWLVLVVVTLGVMLYGLAAEKTRLQVFSPVWEITLFYLVFVTASLLLFVKNRIAGAALVVVTALSLAIFSASPYFALIAFFLITIVHVFVFTAAFVLYGALKSRSRPAALSLAVFALCAVSFFVFVPSAPAFAVSEYVRSNYSSFQTLNAELIKLFRLGPGTSLREIYESSAGLIVMRLIAFAYTYHYLNWFSKTSIIKWHEISRMRAAVIGASWTAALALYGYSYALGMTALYFLSVLHVMLEFPLNHQTFAGIGKELYALARPAPAGVRKRTRGKSSPA